MSIPKELARHAHRLPFAPMRLARGLVPRGLVLLGAAWALAGCGATPREQVEAKLQQFAHATAQHDYKTLCTQVLAPSLISRLEAAGLTCPRAMQVFVGSVSNPTISVSHVVVKGSNATAVVLAGATGQTAALETVGLLQTSNGWRLATLASPR
jgi:hypothetical protein